MIADAARIVRKTLLVRDQPLKAYELLKKLNLPELKDELERTKACIAHVFDKDRYIKYYSEELKEESNPTWFKRYQWVIDKLGDVKTVCDVGCGTGELVGALVDKGYKATGVNLFKPSLDYARKTYPKATFIESDARDWQPSEKYDAVIAQEILEHIPDDKAFIDHCASLTNGWVYLTTPDGPVLDGEGNLGHWEHDMGGGVRGHIRVYNEETLRKLLEGYEIGELTHDVDNGVKYLYVQYKKK